MAKTKLLISRKLYPEFEGDSLIIALPSGVKTTPKELKSLDDKIDNILSQVLKSEEFGGKASETFIINLFGKYGLRKIILVGLGDTKELNAEQIRKSTAAGIRVAEKTGGEVGVLYSQLPDSLTFEILIKVGVEGALLSLYRFDKYKSPNNDNHKTISSIAFIVPEEVNVIALNRILKTAETIAYMVWFGREITNLPGNEFSPSSFALQARKLAKKPKVKIDVLEKDRLKKLGMNAILAVGQGSEHSPMMIVMEYGGGKKGGKPVVLVGKGVTFDSGGISIKPPSNMDEMKQDMAGGAAVLSAFKAAVELKIPINLVGIIPTVENMPSGGSYRPGDIIKTHSGITVEVLNTDAEGRLILADGLSYAKKFKPEAIFDIATLTGAAKIALGTVGCAILSYDDELIEKLQKASEDTGEKVWRLPLWKEFDKQIESSVADIKNTGGRAGGTITAAKFLGKFAEGYPWAHIDIANVDYAESDGELWRKGATGFGIRLLISLIRNWNS